MLAIAPVFLLLGLASHDDGTPPEVRPARAPTLIVGEPVAAVAGGAAGVLAVAQAGDVLLLDAGGRVRRRFVRPAARPTFGGAARSVARATARATTAGGDGFAIAAGVLPDGDFTDPYDVDSDVEDPTNLVIDDTRAGRPPARGPPSSDGPVTIAAGGRRGWIAWSDRLVRVSLDAEANAPAFERLASASGEPWRALAASSDGRWLAGVRGAWLVRSGDGGETFQILGPASGSVARLAITTAGDVLANGAGSLRVFRLAGASSKTAEILDVCAQGRRGLALGPAGLAQLEPDGTSSREILAPADADHLACDAGGRGLARYGADLWTSPDGGRTWSQRMDLPPVAIVSVTIAAGSVWVATARGLWTLPLAAPTRGRPSGEVGAAVAEGATVAGARPADPIMLPPLDSAPRPRLDLGVLGARRPPWWAEVLPQVHLAFASALSRGRRDVRAFFLLSFAVGRDRGRLRAPRELLRRVGVGVAVTPREAWPSGGAFPRPPSASPDPIDAEERAALSRVLEGNP